MENEFKRKEFKIEVPENYEIDKENSTFEYIKFKLIKKALPKTWKEFCETHPIVAGECYLTTYSECRVIDDTDGSTRDTVEDRNFLPSKELAEAMLALCQLIQLRDCYNDGWKPDWSKTNFNKYIIYLSENEITTSASQSNNRILAFKTKELRDQFYKNFKDLIEIAKPLL